MPILLLETIHPDAERVLAATSALVRSSSPSVLDGSIRYPDVVAIVTRSRGRVTGELLDRCPRLAVIGRCGVGLDNVDLAAAQRLGIPVVHTPGANTATVAEHALALILCLVRGIVPMAAAAAGGGWERRDGYAGDEVAGKTLGVVGYGAIGRRLAVLARAIGLEVVVAAHPSVSAAGPTPPVLPLRELLAQADIVSLHIPLRAATRGLIGRDELGLLKPTAYLVNTARGAIVDEPALAEALGRGALAGYAADVLTRDPPARDHPLIGLERVLITPHIASLTASTYRALCGRLAENVVAVLQGRPPEPGSVWRDPLPCL